MILERELAHAFIMLVINKGDTSKIDNKVESALRINKVSGVTKDEVINALMQLYNEHKSEFESYADEFVKKTFMSSSIADKRLARGIYRRMLNSATSLIKTKLQI